MKKIKKILPLLLGVMILVFGTLTVSAASVTENEIYNAMIKYAEDNNITLYTYKAFFADSGKGYELVCSQKPLAYNTHPSASNEQAIFTTEKAYGFTLRYSSGTVSIYNGVKEYPVHSLMGSSYRLLADGNYYSHNIFKYDDSSEYIPADRTGFFPLPPVAQVAETLPPVVQNQAKVILITAIACLALLIILLVLPKKLPRFLNR